MDRPVLLLVDDDPLFRDSIVKLIRRLRPDVSIVTAGNGESAIDVISHHSISAVLSDVEMPNGDGFVVAKAAISWMPRRADRIMLWSGSVDDFKRAKAAEIGVEIAEKDTAILPALLARLLPVAT